MAGPMDHESRRAQLQAQVKAQAEEFIHAQPPEVQNAISLQQAIQTKRDELERQYKEELDALTRKYETAYAPVYVERKDLLEQHAIPKFWAMALANLPHVDGLPVTEKDMEVLAYVQDITSELLPGGKGFSVSLHFKDNPYITNKTLTNTYYVSDMGGDSRELEKAIGTQINWQPGKDVTVKVMKRKPKGPGQKVLTKTEPCESFFHFFTPPEIPADIEDLAEEEIEDMEDKLEACYMLGSAIRDHLIPKALQWYTGEALVSFEDDYMTEEETEDEDGDEEDEDDEEEEESSGAEETGQLANAQGTVNPDDPNAKPECKQQ